MATPSRLETGCQVVQHVPSLLAARSHHRQHSLHEPAPVGAVGSPADPTPDHRVPLGTLRCGVFRRHPLDPCEGPQAPLPAQDLAAGPTCRRADAARPVLQSRFDLTPQPGHRRAESPPVRARPRGDATSGTAGPTAATAAARSVRPPHPGRSSPGNRDADDSSKSGGSPRRSSRRRSSGPVTAIGPSCVPSTAWATLALRLRAIVKIVIGAVTTTQSQALCRVGIACPGDDARRQPVLGVVGCVIQPFGGIILYTFDEL